MNSWPSECLGCGYPPLYGIEPEPWPEVAEAPLCDPCYFALMHGALNAHLDPTSDDAAWLASLAGRLNRTPQALQIAVAERRLHDSSGDVRRFLERLIGDIRAGRPHDGSKIPVSWLLPGRVIEIP